MGIYWEVKLTKFSVRMGPHKGKLLCLPASAREGFVEGKRRKYRLKEVLSPVIAG